MLKKKDKGFSLIEIIVVLIILGVIAAIAVPTYFSWIERCKVSEAYLGMKNLTDKIDACISSGDTACNCVDKMRPNIFSDFVSNKTPNFRYGAVSTGIVPYCSSTVGEYQIFASRVNSAGTDLLSGAYPTVVINCNGSSWQPNNQVSMVILCRSANGTKTYTGVGAYIGT